uniref:uncharacterized protein LOC120344297 n=1 Tax=Styela clava TaxID=7725 RepID=UPI00193A2397|nr:uncharacterized protein LOC120344297 [Styela clava]
MEDQVPSLFLENNLLSEDDWGGSLSHLIDLKDLTSNDSLNNSPASDFCIEDEGRYQECQLDFYGENGLGQNVDSVLSSESSPLSENCDFVDELLQDLLQNQSSSQQNIITDDILLQQVTSGDVGTRRYSTHTSSSSAYSSCSDSGTPSPTDQFSDHGSCSSIDFQDHDVINSTVIESDTLLMKKTPLPVKAISKPNLVNPKLSQSKRNSKTVDCIKKLQETDLDKAVRLACEETNRLLRLHRSVSNGQTESPVSSPLNNGGNGVKTTENKPENDLLKSLCEETILDNSVSQKKNRKIKVTSTLPDNHPNSTKPQKRKASSLQNAIDRLYSANKTMCLSSQLSSQPTPFNRSALLNNLNGTSQSHVTKPVQLESINIGSKEPCFIVSQPSQPPTTQRITLEGVNGQQTYTLTPTTPPTAAPIQVYIKQESPTYQSAPLVNGFIQSSPQSVLSNQKVYVTTGSNSNVTSAPCISIIKPEQLLCNNGQTIVIQQPQQQSSLLKPVNISNMKPGTEPMLLSQSDLSRLAAQGVIKFPTKKVERNLMPVSDESKVQLKRESKSLSQTSKAITPTVCDILPSEAAGIINGTSVFVHGTNNQPQRGELDVKALKRHQRMIKNRASACESRQRRKEYLKTLEDQVSEVADENKGLREENNCLKARLRELEIENQNLRNIINITQSKQKKAACLLMLMLFIGINFSPIGLFGNSDETNNDPFVGSYPSNGLAMPVSGQSSVRSGRHLLSILNDNDDSGNNNSVKMSKATSNSNKIKADDKSLIPSKTESYWMDDLVQEYKNKHLENFLRLLSETTSNSVKRMLRRKLKEELGISIPLPVPRHRRISYTPRVAKQRADRNTMAKSTIKSTNEKNDLTSSISPIMRGEMKMPTSLPQPCEQPHVQDQSPALNETETIRVNDDLTQWAKRYSVDRQEKAQKKAQTKKLVEKKVRNTKSPSSRYDDFENSTSTNEIAIYTRPNQKFDDFFEAISRRNDTFYVVSLNRDHLLLPASVQNTSSRMKMALVMPAVTSKGGSAHDHVSDEYETMIHIECEVLNTRMFDLKRKDVPDYLNINPNIKTIDNAANDTLSSDKEGPTTKKRNIKRNSKKIWKKSTSTKKQRKIKEKEKTEEQKNQEEDAFVSDVTDHDRFYEIPPT